MRTCTYESFIRFTLLYISVFCFMLSAGYAQESLPLGAKGDSLEAVKTDTLSEKWNEKRWHLFKRSISTFKFGGGFLYEFAGYNPDATSNRQMDSLGASLDNTFAVRDFRITIGGQFKTKRMLSWKAGFMYDGVTNKWFVRETGLMLGVPELWGSIFIGRTKEGFSLNKVMVGYAGWTMERQMAIDVIPILADGFKWLGYLPKQRIFWNTGIYADWLSKGQSFSTYRWQYALRAGWLPIYNNDKKEVFHTGINYRYGQPVDDQIKVRSRPEVNEAPYFIESGTFSTDHSNHLGLEFYYRKGPFMTGTEVYAHYFHSDEALNPTFYGGDMMVSYLLTGESRTYTTSNAIFGFVPVSKSVFKGGPGAWEVLVRYSTYNLDSGNIEGGQFWRITPMVNWYLSNNVRLEMAYGFGELDRFNLTGATQFFQARIQLSL